MTERDCCVLIGNRQYFQLNCCIEKQETHKTQMRCVSNCLRLSSGLYCTFFSYFTLVKRFFNDQFPKNFTIPTTTRNVSIAHLTPNRT